MSENTYGSSSFPLQPILFPLIHQRHPGHEFWIPIRGNVLPSIHHPYPNHEPHIPFVINVQPRVHHSNWQSHAPISATIPAFRKVSQSVDPANSSENNLEKPRRNRDKKWLDPILVTYTELLPKLLAEQLIALSCAFLFSHHFPNHTILMSIVTIILRIQGIRRRIVFLSNRKCKHLLRLGG